MYEFISILLGIVGGFVSMWLQSAFISRRDTYVNSKFAITVKKIGWWIVGFVLGCGAGVYFK
jgi:hypothetical protein